MSNQPGAIDNITDLLAVTNRATTSLAGNIAAGTMTITVDDGSVFPSSGRFKITIENEIIDIASRSNNDLTVELRGAEGTVAAAHGTGAPVVMNHTAGHYETLRDAIIATQQGHIRYPDAHSGPQGRQVVGTDIYENVRRFSL